MSTTTITTTKTVEMKPVQFPTENGVEIRTMGQSLRPIRLVYELKQENVQGGRMQIALTGRMFAVDLECQDQIIPGLARIVFDTETVKGMIGGRLERTTSDVVVTDPEHPFTRGYMREQGHGVSSRVVSEPFMLFGVVTLGREQFKEQRERAEFNYRTAPQNPVLPKGAWD